MAFAVGCEISVDMKVYNLHTKGVKMQVQNAVSPVVQGIVKEKKSFEKEQVAPDLSLNARFASMVFASSEESSGNALAQSSLLSMVQGDSQIKDFLMGLEGEGGFSLTDLGYKGSPILELSSSEASDLLGEGGFFSVEETAGRASNFVLSGAGDDVSRLKAGREGIVKGFEAAEKAWGGQLPDIAYETQKLTLEQIDTKIQSLGAHALNVAA